MTELSNIVVVGASLAGLRAAETLRREGYAGWLTILGAEPHRPYDRPPLSKEVLAGKRDPDGIVLRKPDAWDELEADWRLGRPAVGLDLAARVVELAGGERVAFDGLVIATGATPRVPGFADGWVDPGVTAGLAPFAAGWVRSGRTPGGRGVHVLRSLDDALALRAELDRVPRVAVVGAGFIGSEVAATCRERGLDVVLIEALVAPLVRGVGERLGALVAQIHVDHGVDLRCGVGVAALEGGARVEGVRLADGRLVPADVVVIGVGVVPETRWLESSGLALENGVLCDETCATAAPDVVAAGDVARWRDARTGERVRFEHWTNAVEQGVAAAQRLLAGPAAAKPYTPVPYVWSDQYDARIQIAGDPGPDCEVRVVDGTLEERKFVALFERAGELRGVVGFNRPRQVVAYRRQLRGA